MKIKLSQIFVVLLGCLCSYTVYSLDLPAFNIISDSGKETYSVTLQMLALMTLFSLIPAIVLTMSSFTRILIVLGILRQAIGMPQTPNNQILIGIALFLSFFVMSPIAENIYNNSVSPYLNEKINFQEALQLAEAPIRKFMEQQIRKSDLETFKEISGKDANNSEIDEHISFFVLIPAFVTSELKTAFQIGFLLFIPFLVIDLVVASVLMAMGMMMLSPLIISLPFKIMLFILVDGWSLVISTLVSSFGGVA